MNVHTPKLEARKFPFQSSPSPICPDGRTPDLDALLDVINKADRYVYIAVMDYMPLIEFSKPLK